MKSFDKLRAFFLLIPLAGISNGFACTSLDFGDEVDIFISSNLRQYVRDNDYPRLNGETFTLDISIQEPRVKNGRAGSEKLIENTTECMGNWETEIADHLVEGFRSSGLNVVDLSSPMMEQIKELVRNTGGQIDPDTAPKFSFQFPRLMVSMNAKLEFNRSASAYAPLEVTLSGEATDTQRGTVARFSRETFWSEIPEIGPNIALSVSRDGFGHVRAWIESTNSRQQLFCYGSPTAAFVYGTVSWADEELVEVVDIVRPQNDICLRTGESLPTQRNNFLGVRLPIPNSQLLSVCYTSLLKPDEYDEINQNVLILEQVNQRYFTSDFGLLCRVVSTQ